MNLLIYLTIPLVITGNPTPGTYGIGDTIGDSTQEGQHPETSETEAYSQYAYGSSVHYKPSALDEFAVDHQGTYYRKPVVGHNGKPSIYNVPSGGSDQHPSFIASNIYARLKDKATKPNKSNLKTVVASPSLEYGLPAGKSSLLKFVQDSTTSQLVSPLYQNVLVPIYQTPVAPAVYQPEVHNHVPVAQHLIQPVLHAAPLVHSHPAPLVPLAHAPVYKTGITPILKTAPGVHARVVPAIEEPVPVVPLVSKAPALSHHHYHHPEYTRFLPSDAIFQGPKYPKTLIHKTVLKSPVLADKAVLKAVLSPHYKYHDNHHHHYGKAIAKAPLLTHYVQSGYIEPELPAKILHSHKSVVKSLISQDTGKVHYGNGVVGLPPGTTVELVPSLSYGYSYSLYPKPNGLYGPPLPLGHLHYAQYHDHLHHHKAHAHHDPPHLHDVDHGPHHGSYHGPHPHPHDHHHHH